MQTLTVEGLRVYRLAHELTLDLYKLTAPFPANEKFELTSQIRRASSSVCANLMEGYHRKSKKEYRRFACISRGSAGELKYHLLLARDLKYISEPHYCNCIKKVDEISKILNSMINSLKNSPPLPDY